MPAAAPRRRLASLRAHLCPAAAAAPPLPSWYDEAEPYEDTLDAVAMDPTAWGANRLTAAQREQFDKDGYLCARHPTPSPRPHLPPPATPPHHPARRAAAGSSSTPSRPMSLPPSQRHSTISASSAKARACRRTSPCSTRCTPPPTRSGKSRPWCACSKPRRCCRRCAPDPLLRVPTRRPAGPLSAVGRLLISWGGMSTSTTAT
eukprot:COSAG04_NODE_89_length_27118_cov_11.171176_13_plen_204_part_00